MYGPLHYWSLEHDKARALKLCKGNFDSRMSLSDDSRQELDWWITNIDRSFNVISHGQPSSTLTTDASGTGWGAVYGTTSTGGLGLTMKNPFTSIT